MNYEFRDYVIIQEVGVGGMGTVFHARHKFRHREVALKVIHAHLARHKDLCDRFLQEAQILDRLEHPNILSVRDYFEDEGRLVIVTDLLKGQTLGDLEDSRVPLTFEQKLYYWRSLLEGVAYAHEQGVIHRDLNPSNVFITHDNRVLLLDFGLSKELHGNAMQTGIGEIMGTPVCMPPETLRRHNKVSVVDVGTEGDLFAVGVVAYRLFGGQLPYNLDENASHGDALAELAVHYSMGEPVQHIGKLNPRLPAYLTSLIMQCLSLDPAMRPTAKGVLLRLKSNESLSTEQLTPVSIPPTRSAYDTFVPSSPPPQHSNEDVEQLKLIGFVSTMAATTVIALAVAILAALRQPEPPPPQSLDISHMELLIDLKIQEFENRQKQKSLAAKLESK